MTHGLLPHAGVDRKVAAWANRRQRPEVGISVMVLRLAEPFLGAECRADFCLGLDPDWVSVQGAKSLSLTSTGRFPIITVALPLA